MTCRGHQVGGREEGPVCAAVWGAEAQSAALLLGEAKRVLALGRCVRLRTQAATMQVGSVV